MNENWARWAKASFAKYFSDLLAVASIPFCLENENKSKPALKSTFVELRVHGPDSKQFTRGQTRLRFDIEFLANVCLTDSKNLYNPEVISGKIEAWCYSCIPMLQTGMAGDPGTLLDCFRLRDDITPVRVTQLGTKDPNLIVAQIVIEAHYEIWLG